MISSKTMYYFVRIVKTISFFRTVNLKIYTKSNGIIRLEIVGSRFNSIFVDTATISSLISAIYIFCIVLIQGIQSKNYFLLMFSLFHLFLIQLCLCVKVLFIFCRKELVEFINSYLQHSYTECKYLMKLKTPSLVLSQSFSAAYSNFQCFEPLFTKLCRYWRMVIPFETRAPIFCCRRRIFFKCSAAACNAK